MPNTNPDKISKDFIFLQKGWKSGHTAVYNLFKLPLFVIVWAGFEPLTFLFSPNSYFFRSANVRWAIEPP